jgi:very-short-patch-repair endonuclease
MLALASKTYAILDVADLASVGIDAGATHRRVRRGRLHRLHRGVYSVVPPELLRPQGRWLAAVKALGPTAALAWPQAGALWELQRAPSGLIHVAVPGSGGRSKRTGISVHRRPTLDPADIIVSRGIPVTSPRRTLLDAKRLVSPARFEELLRKAELLQLDTGELGVAADTHLNLFEQRFLTLSRRHGLPRPKSQQIVGPYTVDFLWPEARVIVETDGWEHHGTPAAFEADRARDAWLTSRGYRVVRITWRQLRDDPADVIRTLTLILASAA